ncbi:uncharacterized protein ACA1_129530 [Acanthamoeba castellanii str. Neff]|uniref:Uncharacterized protein n=1 Tax=Acanthamoeba castellanii (strain ATCC 30010 / Neff) TaxID=1257118 RepID=L8GQ97_ACACF|nr:uncharacterized protein ACA1_129530 [Acanthamoeba castellanii str. Neff]ELR14828.1 hypothetical protein ACA1_129530 [Acanthamoeba castellanii str. Neff]
MEKGGVRVGHSSMVSRICTLALLQPPRSRMQQISGAQHLQSSLLCHDFLWVGLWWRPSPLDDVVVRLFPRLAGAFFFLARSGHVVGRGATAAAAANAPARAADPRQNHPRLPRTNQAMAGPSEPKAAGCCRQRSASAAAAALLPPGRIRGHAPQATTPPSYRHFLFVFLLFLFLITRVVLPLRRLGSQLGLLTSS